MKLNNSKSGPNVLTIDFQLGSLGVTPPWSQLVVCPAEVFPPVRLLHLWDGEGEGHVSVIREHGLLFELRLPALIIGAPSHSVLTRMSSYHYRGYFSSDLYLIGFASTTQRKTASSASSTITSGVRLRTLQCNNNFMRIHPTLAIAIVSQIYFLDTN